MNATKIREEYIEDDPIPYIVNVLEEALENLKSRLSIEKSLEKTKKKGKKKDERLYIERINTDLLPDLITCLTTIKNSTSKLNKSTLNKIFEK